MKKLLPLILITAALGGCFGDDKTTPKEPESPSDEDAKRMESVGDKEFKNIDW